MYLRIHLLKQNNKQKPETIVLGFYFLKKSVRKARHNECRNHCSWYRVTNGAIVNTNSAYLAQELAKNSIPTYYQQVVGDNEERMYEAI